MVVLAIGLLIGGYRWRVRSIKARSRELEKTVQERTQEYAAPRNQAKSIFLAT